MADQVTKRELADVQKQVDAQSKRLNDLGRVDVLDAMQKKIDALQKRVATLESHVTDHNRDMWNLNKMMTDKVAAAVGNLDGRLKQLGK
jgi:hypothetical protein